MTTTTTEQVGTMTAEDITALRTANRIILRFSGDDAQLECVRVLPRRAVKGYDATDEREVTRTIIVRSFWRGTAFFMAHFNSGAFQALGLILRPGDEVIARCAPNGNSYLDKAIIPAEAWDAQSAPYHGRYDRLYHDCAWITVRRKGREIIHDLLVGDSICPDNSARAIQSGR